MVLGPWLNIIIIRSKFFFLFVGQEPTTWPADNCLQIMVCSCAMPSHCVWLSPAKNVWLVDARPRDIAKFKMAAIPSSFVYSSGKNGYFWNSLDFLLSFFTYSYGIRSLRVLAGLPDSTLDSSRSRRTTIFLMKAGSLERTAFVHSSMQRRNKTLWVLWNCLDTWKLFYYFFFFLPKR